MRVTYLAMGKRKVWWNPSMATINSDVDVNSSWPYCLRASLPTAFTCVYSHVPCVFCRRCVLLPAVGSQPLGEVNFFGIIFHTSLDLIWAEKWKPKVWIGEKLYSPRLFLFFWRRREVRVYASLESKEFPPRLKTTTITISAEGSTSRHGKRQEL